MSDNNNQLIVSYVYTLITNGPYYTWACFTLNKNKLRLCGAWLNSKSGGCVKTMLACVAARSKGDEQFHANNCCPYDPRTLWDTTQQLALHFEALKNILNTKDTLTTSVHQYFTTKEIKLWINVQYFHSCFLSQHNTFLKPWKYEAIELKYDWFSDIIHQAYVWWSNQKQPLY